MKKSERTMLAWVVVIAVVALGIWWWSVQTPPPPGMAGEQATSSTPIAKTPTKSSNGTKTTPLATDAASVAERVSNASVFGSWLAQTGVASVIKGVGPYTIFVPTDAAVAKLAKGTYTNLSAAEKKRFVEYHIIAGRKVNIGAQVAGYVESLSRDELNFSFVNGVQLVNSSRVVAQYPADNGIVYVIDAVLLPPKTN